MRPALTAVFALFFFCEGALGVCVCGELDCNTTCELRTFATSPEQCCPDDRVCALTADRQLTCVLPGATCGDYFNQWAFEPLMDECCVPYDENNNTVWCATNETHHCCPGFACLLLEEPCPVPSSFVSESEPASSSSSSPPPQPLPSPSSSGDWLSDDSNATDDESSVPEPAPPSSSSPAEPKGGFPTWAIAVVIVGGALVIGLVIAGIVICAKKHKHAEKKSNVYGGLELDS